MLSRIAAVAALCACLSCGVDDSNAATNEDGVSATEQGLVAPVYLGVLYDGPHKTWCNGGYAPPPCPGFQEVWTYCPTNSCKCNRLRNGNIKSDWRFYPTTAWRWGDVQDCR